MSNGITRPSARKQANNALKAIEELQQALPQIIAATNQAFNRVHSQLSPLVEQVDAIVSILGEDQVVSAIEANRLERAAVNAEQTKANIAKGLEEGKLLVGETIGDQSIVIGAEHKEDGALLPPGYVALRFAEIKPDFQEKLKGQSVGFEVPTETNGKFVVSQVLEFAPEKPELAQSAPPPEGTTPPPQAIEGPTAQA